MTETGMDVSYDVTLSGTTTPVDSVVPVVTELLKRCRDSGIRPGSAVADMERGLIEGALAHFGNQRKAAAFLGIGVRTLGMKLAKWRAAAAVLVLLVISGCVYKPDSVVKIEVVRGTEARSHEGTQAEKDNGKTPSPQPSPSKGEGANADALKPLMSDADKAAVEAALKEFSR